MQQSNYPAPPEFVDEAYESPETVDLKYEESIEGGPLRTSDSPSRSTPMPDYPRVPLLHPQGFEANRAYNEPTFAYQAPPHASQPSGTLLGYSTQMTPVNNYSHTSRAYEGQPDAYPLEYNAPPSPALRIVSFAPNRGRPGAHFTVSISASFDVMADTASFQFGSSRKCQANIQRDSLPGNDRYHFLLSSQVPDIREWVSEVPVMLVIDSPNGEEYTEVGSFTYDEGIVDRSPLRMGPEDVRHGRIPGMDMRNDIYQQSYQPYQVINNNCRPSYSMAAPYESVPAHPIHDNSSQHQSSHSQQVISPWNSQSRNNSIVGGRHLSAPNPRLVRTSTLEANRTPLGNSFAGTSGYYHQAMKPPAVTLRFESDLGAMGRSDRWPEEHLRSSRRVVYFYRKQRNAEINLGFRVAAPDDIGGGGNQKPPNMIAVSCILWPRKRLCYVTSVDTIALLEFIMAQKFPTEEKNRIRRNLEHFKPVTVKKPIPGSGPGNGTSDDTTELFSTIMSFSAPKPRNIEKDIKVFKWSDLSNALRKITGKYSIKPTASLPPPAQALPTPASSTGGSSGGYSMDNSGLYQQSHDRTSNGMFSPRGSISITRSISGHSMHNNYAPSSFAGTSGNQRLNSPPHALNPIRGYLGDMNQQGMSSQMATFEQHPANVNQWPTTPTHHMPAPHAPSHYGTPRPSWDLGMGAGMGGSMPGYAEQSSGNGGAAGVGVPDIQHPGLQNQAHSSLPRTAMPHDILHGGLKQEMGVGQNPTSQQRRRQVGQ